MEYNGKCYEQAKIMDGDKLICQDDYTLKDGMCYRLETREAMPRCETGEYHGDDDSCYDQIFIGDAYEFCRDPGRTLSNHKCLATKPTVNGGCLNGDMLYNGKCVNTRNDYYASDWMCPNGKNNSTDKGDLIFPDNKCYEEKRVGSATYYCEDDLVLNGKTCTKEHIQSSEKEKVCPSGFTKVPFDRCINMNNVKDYETGLVCNQEHSRVVGDVCIIYEVKEANHF